MNLPQLPVIILILTVALVCVGFFYMWQSQNKWNERFQTSLRQLENKVSLLVPVTNGGGGQSTGDKFFQNNEINFDCDENINCCRLNIRPEDAPTSDEDEEEDTSVTNDENIPAEDNDENIPAEEEEATKDEIIPAEEEVEEEKVTKDENLSAEEAIEDENIPPEEVTDNDNIPPEEVTNNNNIPAEEVTDNNNIPAEEVTDNDNIPAEDDTEDIPVKNGEEEESNTARIECLLCGGDYARGRKNRHEKTKLHLAAISRP